MSGPERKNTGIVLRRRTRSERTPLDLLPNGLPDLGVELWCKRDDLYDGIGSGHKARKLAYLVDDAKKRGATVLMTAAAIPSGQAVAVAAAAQQAGLRAHIVYCGDHQVRPAIPEANYLLVGLLGADVTWRERSPWLDWRSYLEEAATIEIARGETPYILEPGLSKGLGLMGSVELGLEIAGQIGNPKRETHLVAVAGSGGTSLGLGIAAASMNLPWKIHGVCMATGGSRAQSEQQDRELRTQAMAFLPPDAVAQADVSFWEGAMGVGYDIASDQELEAMRSGLQRHGLILDTTYMAKAYIGMAQLIQSGEIPPGSRVILVHTGGSLDIFRSTPPRDAWISTQFADYAAPQSGPTGLTTGL